MHWNKVFLCLILCAISKICFSQDSSLTNQKRDRISQKLFSSVESKSDKLERKFKRQASKYLHQLERQEMKIQRLVSNHDSLQASHLSEDIKSFYSGISSNVNRAPAVNIASYCAYVDSMQTALRFLDKQLALGNPALQKEIDATLSHYKTIQTRIGEMSSLGTILKQREETLNRKFEELGITTELTKLKKLVYYYRTEAEEYKTFFESPSNVERATLDIALKNPAFKNFFAKYSELGRLFPMREEYGTFAGLQGLQTRESVQAVIQQKIATGPSAMQQISANIQHAQDELKNKIQSIGGNANSLETPDFKFDNQKSKSFFDRLEVGTNLQTLRSTPFYPTTTDIGLSLGYKLNEKSTIGIGGSYKVGFGDWNHVSVTSEGIGIRSFLDVKIKGTFYISGGFEYNYQQPFNTLQQIEAFENWQQSGLVGLTKMLSLQNRFLKKSKVQLLWDFLSYRQQPATQPFKFRFGYNF
jgi:hypothetical protein